VTRYDLAVIGGGPAGLSAAMYGGMRGLSTAVFEAEAFGGQLINLYPTKPVTNFPAHAEIASRDIALQLAEQAGRFGAELYDWSPVEFVGRDGADFVIRAGGNATGDDHGGNGQITARTLILAMGMGRFMPRRLGLPDEARLEGRGLAYRLPPIDEITARHVVVVGGGDSALDTALSLRSIAEVTIVHRREAFSAYAFSQKRLAEADIKLVTNGEIVELVGQDHLERVVVALTDGETPLRVSCNPWTIHGWRPFSVSAQPAVFMMKGMMTAQMARRKNQVEVSIFWRRSSHTPHSASRKTSPAR